MKILHLAVQNYAGMPMDFVKMHRKFGINSQLISLFKGHPNFPPELCLNLPQPSGRFHHFWQKAKFQKRYKSDYKILPPEAKPKNTFEQLFFQFRDFTNAKRIHKAIIDNDLFNYDIYHLDGGMGFFRNSKIIKQLKNMGKKIVCVYFGSDLRLRGLIKPVDQISDLNITLEYDHLKLYNKLEFIFVPFNVAEFEQKTEINSTIKIVHSPTNRELKGTKYILKAIKELKKIREFDFYLLENMSHKKLLEEKAKCDIAIEQVGNFGGEGYGRNSLETLSMGIPTVTDFSDEYFNFLPGNPFVRVNIQNLKSKLLELIDNSNLLKKIGEKSRNWIEEHHSYKAVNKQLNELYIKYKII